jgi:tetratricopeptide (TPR) repeat protein
MMRRAGLCILFLIHETAFAQKLETPVAILLRGAGAEYARMGDLSYLKMPAGEILFSGDSFRTGPNPVTILTCGSRQVLEVPAHESGVTTSKALNLRPHPASSTRSVPECEMPLIERRKPAGESHVGSAPSNHRLLLPSPIKETTTDQGIARVLKQLAEAERTGDESRALSLTQAFLALWPEAAWVQVKLFQHATALTAATEIPAAPEGTSAIVIGISKYKNPEIPKLNFADADALMMARFLQSKRGGSIPDNRLALLLNEQATAVAIRAAFNRLIKRGTSTVVIFIAAHGNERYIANYDYNPQDPHDIAIPLDELNALVTNRLSGVKALYLYVDSCRSGNLQGLNWKMAQAPHDGHLMGLASSKADELSWEYPELGGGHGVFSWFLNEALTATGSKVAAVSTNRDAIYYVQKNVSDFVFKREGKNQNPKEFGNYNDRAPLIDFSLEGPVKAAAALAGTAASAGKGRSREPRLDLEDAGEDLVSRYLAGEADPLKKEDFEDAAKSFDDALELAPESVWLESRAAFAHGRSFIFDKRYDDAIDLLDHAIRLDPSGAIAYNALGIAYLEKPDYPRALAAFEDAIRRAPLWAYAWHNKALAESQMGNYRRAIESYKHAIAVAPKEIGSPPESGYYYLPYSLGALYQSLNRLREAEAQYQKARQMTTRHGEPENAIGTIWALRGKRDRAIEWFRKALQKDSKLAIAQRNLDAMR